MVETHQHPLPPMVERKVLRTPKQHRNQGALQRALRQERVARRRNFFGWLMTVLLAVGAGASIVFWIAQRAAEPNLPLPSVAPGAVIDDPILNALPAASEAVPVGAEHALPAR